MKNSHLSWRWCEEGGHKRREGQKDVLVGGAGAGGEGGGDSVGGIGVG